MGAKLRIFRGRGDEVQGSVSSTDNAIVRFDGTTGKIIQSSAVEIDDDGNVILAGDVYVGISGGPRINFSETNGYMSVSSDFGVGTSNPTSRLHVVDSENITPGPAGDGHAKFEGNGYSAYIALDAIAMYLGHNSSNREFRLQINETDKLVVTTADRMGFFTMTPSRIADFNQGGGNIIADGYDTHSLCAYKEDVSPVSGGFLDRLASLRLFRFRRRPHVSADELRRAAIRKFGLKLWKKYFPRYDSHRGGALGRMPDCPMKRYIDAVASRLRCMRRASARWKKYHIGLIADDDGLSSVVPEVVSCDDDGRPIGIDVVSYVGFLHGCISELVSRVEGIEKNGLA